MEFDINAICHQQIAEKLGVPKRYYDRMMEDAPGLLLDNVNTWLREEPGKRMVRTLDGSARAFLSDRYRPLDNYDLVQVVFPALQEAGCEMKSCQVTDSRLYLQAVAMDITSEIRKDSVSVGDIVKAGVCVQNSEVGQGTLSVQPLLYRLACKNGMIVPIHGMKQTHLGKSHGESGEITRHFQQDTLAADDKAFFLKVRDTVKGVLSEDVFGSIVGTLEEGTARKIEGDPVGVIEVVQEHIGLSDGERGNVLRHLIEGGDLSQWGVVNAVTRSAEDCESYDRGVELETDAWKIAELDNAGWARMAAA